MTSTVDSTTVACSHYLSAQSASASSIAANPVGDIYWQDQRMVDYQASLGRSPECTSYARGLGFNNPAASKHLNSFPFSANVQSSLTYSNCANNASSTLLSPVNYLPAGIGVSDPTFDFRMPYCCGGCSFSATEFRLIYFPRDPLGNCSSTAGNNTLLKNGTSTLHGAGGHSSQTNSSMLLENTSSLGIVSNGYTL